MSPTILQALTAIRNDMKSFPQAYTSATALEFFLRYRDIRVHFMEGHA